MVTVPVASVLLVNNPIDPKFIFVALTLQLLTTVAVAEDEVLAVLLPVGHEVLPLMPY
jgi:hypothetical protein